ncbi:rhodanese-like domain-containing protein [Marivirga arenosa]|uniref:Rhodanese-like domain-containing protein n=1 Tax=Marivirga arenosa TaxID=3059076 RepID=A0AA49JC83_9BACT|nr:rhodanese-like domain-containing protein [Marivirga sp. BKB1-2]WKK79217.2 rhodanese-like domain-containing protein [Marivirga sp. BKB1-2]
MPNYKNLTIQEFDQGIKENPEAIILDVRTPSEFASGHLEHAVNAPNISEAISSLDPEKEYFVHCRVGGRSAVTAQYLSMKGFKNINNLNDSIDNTSLKLHKSSVKVA